MINAKVLKRLETTEEQLIEHLDKDVREIFSTMVGVDISASLTAVTETKFKHCVTAMVGFAGNYSGMISINAPQSLAMTFTSQMLGMDVEECGDDVHDALGEIANMMGGSFKHHFVNDGHEVQLSTPSVISGEEYVMTVGSVPDTLTLMFESGAEHFLVSVYLESEE
ncbi:chemotaxis protein CheX [Pelotalea chapellei]|uniref:Chemotaxis protein CheX n=1 Tax=Pelotalea chapellei TaxID=44671 RepID=A0ABS5UAA4_9BACT|nr:chemotaxis protein CheX [Pelotalea chapellei]MBT1072617.1 chemotaxis protein CheX [Pelotalea chapellei]